MYKRVIMLLGLLLCSHAPAVGQTPAPQIVLAQEPVASTITMFRKVSIPSSDSSFLLSQDHGKSNARFTALFARPYERDQSLDRLPPIEEVKTLIITESSLPLTQLWSGRLQLDAFQGTLHIQSMQTYPGAPRSVDLSGLSLSFHFGRNARTGSLIQAWRCLPRIVGTVLN